MRSSVFCSCLTVYSVMRNTRLWQCRRGLCPSDWSTLCWRPIRMENSSLHVVIRFVQPQTWSCSKVGSPSTTSTLKDTSMLKIYCVQHAKKNIYIYICIDGKQQVSKPWKSKVQQKIYLFIYAEFFNCDRGLWNKILAPSNNIFSSFVDRISGIDLSKCSALILSAHTTRHGTHWYSGVSDIPGSKCYRYLIYPI